MRVIAGVTCDVGGSLPPVHAVSGWDRHGRGLALGPIALSSIEITVLLLHEIPGATFRGVLVAAGVDEARIATSVETVQ